MHLLVHTSIPPDLPRSKCPTQPFQLLVQRLSTGLPRLDIHQLHVDNIVQLDAVLVIQGAEVCSPVEDNLLDLWGEEEIEYAVTSSGRERLNVDEVRLRVGCGCAEDDDRQGTSNIAEVPSFAVKYENG